MPRVAIPSRCLFPRIPRSSRSVRGDYFAPWYSYTLTVTSTDGAGESHQEILNIPIGQPVGAVRVKLAQFIDRKSASTTLHFSNDTYRSPCRGSDRSLPLHERREGASGGDDAYR